MPLSPVDIFRLLQHEISAVLQEEKIEHKIEFCEPETAGKQPQFGVNFKLDTVTWGASNIFMISPAIDGEPLSKLASTQGTTSLAQAKAWTGELLKENPKASILLPLLQCKHHSWSMLLIQQNHSFLYDPKLARIFSSSENNAAKSVFSPLFVQYLGLLKRQENVYSSYCVIHIARYLLKHLANPQTARINDVVIKELRDRLEKINQIESTTQTAVPETLSPLEQFRPVQIITKIEAASGIKVTPLRVQPPQLIEISSSSQIPSVPDDKHESNTLTIHTDPEQESPRPHLVG